MKRKIEFFVLLFLIVPSVVYANPQSVDGLIKVLFVITFVIIGLCIVTVAQSIFMFLGRKYQSQKLANVVKFCGVLNIILGVVGGIFYLQIGNGALQPLPLNILNVVFFLASISEIGIGFIGVKFKLKNIE